MTPEHSTSDRDIPRNTMALIIYVAIFGVLWGLGTSILAGALPPELVTRAIVIGWFEAGIMLLTKVMVCHRLSVTYAIGIASTISIFTFSFGPPNPYKPLFLLAGFAFDAGSLFRTGRKLTALNLITGSIAYILVAGGVFIAIFWLLDPAAVPAVAVALPLAAAIFVAFAIGFALVYRRTLLLSPPPRLQEVWRQLGHP